MEPIYIVAGISFVFGAMGYVIFQFWLVPILKYRKIKGNIASVLRWYAGQERHDGRFDAEKKQLEEKMDAARKHSAELSEVYSVDLPRWYTMLLLQREESPLDAAKHLMKLPNIRNAEHAVRCVEKIGEHLKINLF